LFKIINLVGARPQFIKAAAISRALRGDFADQTEEILVHSGQHYDQGLSAVFFRELGLPEPHYHFKTAAGSQEEQSNSISNALEEVFAIEKPDALVVYGDTTTTLAGAKVAAKRGVPIAHIEAGLRSYNLAMPEENNRVQTDQLSTFLFVPTTQGMQNLIKEGITHQPPNKYVFHVGDVMLDSLRIFSPEAELSAPVAASLNSRKPLILLTLHRNFNADSPAVLQNLFAALEPLLVKFQVVFPVHPRTRKNLEALGIKTGVTLLPPVSYFEMLALEQRAAIILTDSGGVQKEAFFFKKPLIILRPETEWVELLGLGVARLCAIDTKALNSAVQSFAGFTYPKVPDLYGDGFAAQQIVKQLIAGLHP
jgi:UDP-GlcNAc3NAcA epimerase